MTRETREHLLGNALVVVVFIIGFFTDIPIDLLRLLGVG